MAGNGRKTQALALLLSGETVSEAARISGAGERTVSRWLSEPAFKSELELQRAQVLESVSGSLVMLSERAVKALSDVLERPREPGANIKRLAAVAVLELVLHWRETLSFEERLSALESEVFKR